MAPRAITNEFLEMVELGCFDNYKLIVSFCKYLSEDEVKDFIRTNEIFMEPPE
jgi:hypothetical protein